MKKMKNVLVLAYAISPTRGSEYAVAWNYVMHMLFLYMLLLLYLSLLYFHFVHNLLLVSHM